MSTRNLIDAIASGSALDIQSAFEDTMAEKVSVQIEAKRLQIAQTMFTTEEVDLDEEQLDELSKGTLDSYRDAAVDHTDKIKKHVASMNQQVKSSIDMVKHYKTGSVADAHRGHVNDAKSELKTSKRLLKNRAAGIDRAGEKLAKNEEVDLDEEQSEQE